MLLNFAWHSDDDVHFRHGSAEPVFTLDMAGSPYGSAQDPRVVKSDGIIYMTYAFHPFAWSSNPRGVGVPESHKSEYPGVQRAPYDAAVRRSGNVQGARPDNMTRSGFAVSTDRINWRLLAWATDPEFDDRDVFLYPEKVGGRFALLRRPLQWVGAKYGTDYPAIWLCYSDDLLTGSYIPNVIFPTANAIKDGLLYLYYGVCDTAIPLATIPLSEVVDRVRRFAVRTAGV